MTTLRIFMLILCGMGTLSAGYTTLVSKSTLALFLFPICLLGTMAWLVQLTLPRCLGCKKNIWRRTAKFCPNCGKEL